MRDEHDRDGLPGRQLSQPGLRPSLPYHSVVQSVTPAAGSEMLARGTILAGFREATVDLWGEEGLRSVCALLPGDVKEQTAVQPALNLSWYPERFIIAWYEALWNGPAGGRRERFTSTLNRMMDFGFGRVRKGLLMFANPSGILIKAGSLWRYDHSHGDLTVEAGDGLARVQLANHPYTADPLSCLAIAEIYRYCVALCRARGVVETHYRDVKGALVVRIRWDA